MPHDPARVADTKGWLSRAATDLRAAAADLAADPPVLDDLVFHCQQAVEKAMKSLLTWHDEPFGKTTTWRRSERPACGSTPPFDLWSIGRCR